MPTPPKTTTATSHALMIKTVQGAGAPSGGQVIGAIHSWAPSMTRGIAELYCFDDGFGLTGFGITQAGGPGEPFEKVPGNVSGMTIRVDRYDLYNKTMETAFGTADLHMLSRQTAPFVVNEKLKDPDGGETTFIYQGCWFRELGRTYAATDDRVIKTNAQLEYVRKLRS